jgi:hypothetical protein
MSDLSKQNPAVPLSEALYQQVERGAEALLQDALDMGVERHFRRGRRGRAEIPSRRGSPSRRSQEAPVLSGPPSGRAPAAFQWRVYRLDVTTETPYVVCELYQRDGRGNFMLVNQTLPSRRGFC